jgi:hypothetical protein
MKNQFRLTLLAAAALAFSTARAADSNQTGHITRVSYITSGVLIMLDTGPPTNCSATPYGWMMIAAPYTAMIAFVTGLWFQGGAASTQLAVYTSGIDGTGYCQVSQIDTQSAG